MLILMSLDAPRKDVDAVKKKVESYGCAPHEIPGDVKLAVGVTGPSSGLKEEDFAALPSVEEVVRVTRKYKLVGRMMKPDDTEVEFGERSVGGEELAIIAGPCSVESREQTFEIAHQLSEMGVKFFRGGAFKPRTSPYAFQGLKEKGLEILAEVKKRYGMHIVTEALNQNTLPAVAEVADVVQIGARNMQNYTLLEEAGETGKPILIKRGMSATLEELLLSAEYVVSRGNYNCMVCERGIRTYEKATRNTLDLNAVPFLKKESHLPVIVDPSHGTGVRELIPSMTLAAIAAGADGVIVEVHHNPAEALSDGFQALTPDAFRKLLSKIKQLAPVVNRATAEL
ncbi:MAG: 3-deoxy-7-phosphoheptulonate synthase [Ignavibacteriales bacterium]|nr:3-deoxy-7-phosphoheptulonate synthase [Ignavibacteriales bacterium]